MLPDKVRTTLEKYKMARNHDRILVGVSGGADSVCLLITLRNLQYAVAAAHVNHGLRGLESDADETFVRKLCDRLGVPFFSRTVEIRNEPGNLEALGREARKDFFSELVKAQGFQRIALAHNRDDRVETLLLNLLRGSGVEGLSSMEPVAGNIIRPLIETGRPEIESYLRMQNQDWRSDSTNLDPRFARNRIRLDLIPRLSADFNSSLVETLSRTLEILDDENSMLRALTFDWISRHGTKHAEEFVFDAVALSQESQALQRRVLRAALKEVGCSLENVTFDHIEAARELLGSSRSGRLVEFPKGFTIERSFEHLVVQKRLKPADEFDYELQIPGEIHIPELNRVYRARIVTKESGNSSSEGVFVDGCILGPCVRIRNWKPGDYYKPVGLPAGKLKKLFQRARVPRNQRHRWPVFVADSTIVWVASFPVSREFAPRGCSQKIVAIEALPI